MPPKKSNTLTEAELRLMKILWRRGESAVIDLVAAMPEGEELAYNSVLTTIRILEQKGYVEHRQEGRAFVYRPCVLEHEAGRSEVRHVLNRFFGNSRERLLLSLLGDGEISAEELERLKEAIRNAAPDGTGFNEPGLNESGLSESSSAELGAAAARLADGAPLLGHAASRRRFSGEKA
jgi:predicted transcriptional regulator